MSLINLTDTAKTHLINLAKEHNKKYVRLEVKGGGCVVLNMTGLLMMNQVKMTKS